MCNGINFCYYKFPYGITFQIVYLAPDAGDTLVFLNHLSSSALNLSSAV